MVMGQTRVIPKNRVLDGGLDLQQKRGTLKGGVYPTPLGEYGQHAVFASAGRNH